MLSDPNARDVQAGHLAIIAINHPDLLHDIEDAWSRVSLDGWLAELRNAILHLPGLLSSAEVMKHLAQSGYANHVARALQVAEQHGRLDAAARAGAMPSTAEAAWWHFFGMIQSDRLNEEIDLARKALANDLTPARQRRMAALCEARIKLYAVELGDA